jgi:hypothetical protein
MEDAFDGGQVRQEPHDDGEEWHIGLLDQAQSPLGSNLDHRQGAGSALRRDPRVDASVDGLRPQGGSQAGERCNEPLGKPGIRAGTCRLATCKALELPSSGHRERSRSGTG